MSKMKTLLLLLSFFVFISPVYAQTRVVPDSKAQVVLSYASVVKKAAPAVVNIYTTKKVRQRVMAPFFDDPFFQQFFGGVPQGPTRERMEQSLGSGVIVEPDGVIVTCNHVINGADDITVVLADRREFKAKVLTADERSDLAVLKIDAKGEVLPHLNSKDSDDVEVGDLVLAIGNPFGVGQTVTSGIVSALARTNLDINDINYFIQTDAAINPGNSGGALVTMDGKLIGINSAIYSRSGGSMGLGFAVPSNMLRTVLESGVAGGKKLARPWIGITAQSVTSDIARSLALHRPGGVLVNAIHPASPTLQAGIKVGDVIIAVNGRNVEDPAAMNYRIATQSVGSEIKLELYRQGAKQEVTVKLIAPPEVPLRDETVIKGRNPLAGAHVANLSPAVVEDFDLRVARDSGVVIVSVKAGTAAARLGLSKGDIILKINGQAVKEARDVPMLLDQAERWRVQVARGEDVINLLVGQ